MEATQKHTFVLTCRLVLYRQGPGLRQEVRFSLQHMPSGRRQYFSSLEALSRHLHHALGLPPAEDEDPGPRETRQNP